MSSNPPFFGEEKEELLIHLSEIQKLSLDYMSNYRKMKAPLSPIPEDYPVAVREFRKQKFAKARSFAKSIAIKIIQTAIDRVTASDAGDEECKVVEDSIDSMSVSEMGSFIDDRSYLAPDSASIVFSDVDE